MHILNTEYFSMLPSQLYLGNNRHRHGTGVRRHRMYAKMYRDIAQVIAFDPISRGVIVLRSIAIALDCRSNYSGNDPVIISRTRSARYYGNNLSR